MHGETRKKVFIGCFVTDMMRLKTSEKRLTDARIISHSSSSYDIMSWLKSCEQQLRVNLMDVIPLCDITKAYTDILRQYTTIIA